jgi:hypothetical protein
MSLTIAFLNPIDKQEQLFSFSGKIKGRSTIERGEKTD